MKRLATFLLTGLWFFCQTSKCQDYSSCGVRSLNTRGRIIGGIHSRPGMWPWQVAIFRGQNKEFHCGGALINSRWVVTAAHCFHSATNEQFKYTVIAGEYNITSKEPNDQERNAFKIYIHPDYISKTYENDIALVELHKGVKMSSTVRTICLPKFNENLSAPGQVVDVAGWGWTGPSRKPSPVLLHSAYQIQINKKCEDATSYPFNGSVMFCAGDGKGGNDTCKGDSGGSLVRNVLRDGRRRWVTVGLVSWGEGCARKDKYGYYTRMESFVNWIQKKTNVSALSCGNPGNIPNGKIIGSDFLIGFTVKYTCNNGYQLRGRSKIRCQRNGQWTKAPTCQKVECRNPGDPRYGVRRPRRSKYFYKDKIRFRCKTNYTIIGRSVMVCQSNRKWNGYKPVCLAPCKDPGVPEGGVRLDHNFKHSDTVRFMCTVKNKKQGLYFRVCSNGRWDQSIPTCIPKNCANPGVPTNGKRDGDDFTLNKKVYFTCNKGHRRVGPGYVQCMSSGKWNASIPTCELIDCGRLPEPQHGEKIEETSVTFGGKVVFRCNKKGYELQGSVQRVCEENGEWSGATTTCERVECKRLGTPVNGVRRPNKNKYVFEDRIDFQCNSSYTLRGNSFINCQHNKTWTGTVPQCLAPCQDPGPIPNGEKSGSDYLHGESVMYSCVPGYSLEGSSVLTCNDGTWDRPKPSCRGSCPDPGTPQGMRREGNSFKSQSSVEYSCIPPSVIVGNSILTCKDGNWSHNVPYCSDCASALGVENRKIPDSKITASSTWVQDHSAKEGRLNGPRAWCSGRERQPYLAIDFGKPYKITAVATQGSVYYNRWVQWYALQSNLARSSFTSYKEDVNEKVFSANTDARSTVKRTLREPVVARKIRVYPIKPLSGFSTNPACMRVEIYGCDLPLDCVMVGSRVVAKWISIRGSGYVYLKAYVTTISRRSWIAELENENHDLRNQIKRFYTYISLPFVLDVPAKHEELRVGTRVLAPWGYRYYTGTIRRARDSNNRYEVGADDGDYGYFTIDQIRLIKTPKNCNN